MSLKLLHQGSVKDIYQSAPDQLLFRFSNRYSIFDWGEMPDAIPGKGRALATMGKKIFKHLNKLGYKTHFVGPGLVQEDFVVKAVSVPRDGVEIYKKNPHSILIPLEVIYRFGVPKGSSLLRKYKSKEDWLAAGFDREYREGESFTQVKIDFTTKLEKMDRVLNDSEAKALAGMNDSEWSALLSSTQKIANELRAVFETVDLKLWDGKIEFAFDESRNIMLVDSVGLDEIRLTFQSETLSKELLRQFYLNTDWYRALNLAKERAPSEFKEYCTTELKQSPETLPTPIIQAISELYQTVSEMILNEDASNSEILRDRLKGTLSVLSRST